MSYNKKWADLKTLTPEQTQRGNFPRDFWNYHTNSITGFPIERTRGEIEAERKYAERKYRKPSQFPDARCNGTSVPKFAKNGF